MKADLTHKESETSKVKIRCSLNGEPISVDEAQKIIVRKVVEMAFTKLQRLERQRAGGLQGKGQQPSLNG